MQVLKSGRVCAGVEPDNLVAQNDYAIPPPNGDEVSHIYDILYNFGKATGKEGTSITIFGIIMTGFEPALTNEVTLIYDTYRDLLIYISTPWEHTSILKQSERQKGTDSCSNQLSYIP